ncbi:15601_t:CDS:2 [Funneliformis mosseae]|uniref:15601_t:CDS:1 n=1 Tax=Funneliformis mosseae TaxID=27381 RepID=A0A9N9C0S1_FUNMO|nr:15601_t:CDS:2 [Funneliformis mosseae]
MSVETSVSAPPLPISRYGNINSIKPIPIQKSGTLTIKELRPWIRGFDITCIILQHLSRRILKTQQEVELHSFLVADETAVCTLVIWENGQHYRGGDIVQITHGETRVHEGSLELTVNKNFGKINIIDWDTMYYKEEEEPNLSSYTWILDESAPNTYAKTFKAYDRSLQPYIIDSTIPNGSSSSIVKQESPVVSIKQEESTKTIKNEEDGTHGGIQHLPRERGTSTHQSRYNGNGNGNGGGQEAFGSQFDSRSQQMSQSPRKQASQQPSQVSPQHNDRPRPPSRRNTKYTRRDSWRDLERGVDGGGGSGRQDRDNRDNRSRNQDINKRAGGGGGGRNQPHLDRPVEEGELTNIDFVTLATGLNRSDNHDLKDMRDCVPHKKPRIE